MSLPPEGRELSSDCLVVSETDSATKSQKTVCAVVRRKKAHLSPFKGPDSNSIFLLSANEKRKQKEEKRKFLALPIQEKTAHAARMMAKLKNELVGELEEEEEEGNEKKRTPEQIQSKIVVPKQTSGRHELKIAMMKGENITKQSRHYLMSMERQKGVLELSLMTKRSEILKMDRAIAKEERQLKQLEKIIERDNRKFEEFLRENEKKSVEARILFEREEKSKQEKNCEIKKLTTQIGIMKNDIAKLEDILTDYKRYKDFLFKLSPPAWQNEQKSKAVKPEVLADKDGLDDQLKEPDEIAIRNGLESKPFSSCGTPPSSKETRLPSAHIDILDSNFKQECDISEYEEDPELYFTDPKQLLHLMTALTDQNVSLIQNSARLEEALEVLQQCKETTKRQIEKDEEQIEEQISYINKKIEKEKARGAKLQQKVQLHVSLNTEDHNKMLEALSEKVTEVHSSCVDDRMTNLSTLEKVANIENCISLLLEDLESIPEEQLQMIKKIKESEKRSKQREEKLIEQREKQEERMRRYLERSLADSKKTSGRKLMPRCMPVTQRVKVKNVENVPAEDDIHEYLFGSEDTE